MTFEWYPGPLIVALALVFLLLRWADWRRARRRYARNVLRWFADHPSRETSVFGLIQDEVVPNGHAYLTLRVLHEDHGFLAYRWEANGLRLWRLAEDADPDEVAEFLHGK